MGDVTRLSALAMADRSLRRSSCSISNPWSGAVLDEMQQFGWRLSGEPETFECEPFARIVYSDGESRKLGVERSLPRRCADG